MIIKMKSIRSSKILLEFSVPIVCSTLFYIGGNTWGSVSFSLALTVYLIGMNLICGQFTFFVDTIRDYYQSCLTTLIGTNFADPSTGLEIFVNAVNRLVSISDDINSIYSLQLLTVIFSSYGSFMINFYFIYRHANSIDGWKNPHIPGDIIMALYYMLLIWRISHSAAQANSKSKEFNTLLYQIMIEDKNKDFLNNRKLKLHISMKREVIFNVCGFFNLDYTLPCSMIASAITYLIIFIQFGDPANWMQSPSTNLNTTVIPTSITI